MNTFQVNVLQQEEQGVGFSGQDCCVFGDVPVRSPRCGETRVDLGERRGSEIWGLVLKAFMVQVDRDEASYYKVMHSAGLWSCLCNSVRN